MPVSVVGSYTGPGGCALEIQLPYLGPVKGFYTDWTPLTDRPGLFPEDIDTSDPWQFRNILVR